MVYLSSAASVPTAQPHTAMGPGGDLDMSAGHKVNAALGGLLACMTAVALVVTFTRCCCWRRKDEGTEEEDEEEYKPPAAARRGHEVGPEVRVVTEVTPDKSTEVTDER